MRHNWCRIHQSLWPFGCRRQVYTLIRMYPGLATFAQIDIQAPAFPVNAVVCSTALAIHIVAMSRPGRAEPQIPAQGIHTHLTLSW